ncbi:hypothetical protein L7F22_001214 [Adiantum nelumboides]|nr:hypothetical protein [Adiantum nelumboides]
MALVDAPFRHSDWEDERSHRGMRGAVLQWSSEQVKLWVQENVSFSNSRLQECIRAFDSETIDGLSLLTLRKSHRACSWMNDFEWLLFKAARRGLLSGAEKVEQLSLEQSDWQRSLTSIETPPCTPTKDDSRMTSPRSPLSLRSSNSFESTSSRFAAGNAIVLSIPRRSWSSDVTRDEQIEVLSAEVQSLRGEIVRAEERQTTLQAQMLHVDYVLRTALLSGYMYTRTRWIPLLEETVDEDLEVDNWLQRFLVFQGSSIFFYMCATDIRPQGTILLDDVVGAAEITSQMQDQNEGPLFSFHISTCHGLRLECSTPSKLQAHSWLSLLGVEFRLERERERSDSV